MASKLSQNEIGKRIAGIRKMKALSQEELAKSIRISRSSLAQIELGNRSVGILELYDLSIALGFSIDEFMSQEYVVCQDKEVIYETKAPSNQTRNSTPELMVSKFQNVILYILERCAGKPNVGETVLNKLLYFVDFNYYEVYEEHLTGALYKKLPYGPVPSNLDYILKEMIRNGSLLRIKTNFHNYPQIRYFPLLKADLTELKASEKEIIDKVIDQMSDWSASAISNYSHKDLPWIASKEGQEIDYELVFYREPPFSVRQYENEAEEP